MKIIWRHTTLHKVMIYDPNDAPFSVKECGFGYSLSFGSIQILSLSASKLEQMLHAIKGALYEQDHCPVREVPVEKADQAPRPSAG